MRHHSLSITLLLRHGLFSYRYQFYWRVRSFHLISIANPLATSQAIFWFTLIRLWNKLAEWAANSIATRRHNFAWWYAEPADKCRCPCKWPLGEDARCPMARSESGSVLKCDWFRTLHLPICGHNRHWLSFQSFKQVFFLLLPEMLSYLYQCGKNDELRSCPRDIRYWNSLGLGALSVVGCFAYFILLGIFS